MRPFPDQARVVIIGGGIVGCSTAYHLAKLGIGDVVLLERCKLTSGSTFHAAGLVGQLRSSANITQLLKYSVELYGRLESETGQATGWKQNGGLRLACSGDRMIELKRQATTARSFGLEMHLLTPGEARDLWPLMESGDLAGAAFLPTDGQANPSDLTQALAKGARRGGVTIIEDCPVTGISSLNGRVSAVRTSLGDIRCETVVNCGGQWAREIGRLAGVTVPLVSVKHQYMVTEPIPGVGGDLPTLRDPDRLTYFKEEVGGLVMGGYEPDPLPWAVDGIPDGFHFTLLEDDWEHFEQLMDQALARVPALAETGVKQMIHGPESFTPDGNFILGEAPELAGFFVGAGFNAFGIAASGGAGWALAAWIAEGAPPMDLWPVDLRRFGPNHQDIAWVRARTLELYGKHYAISWPQEEHESARPARRSPLYARLRENGACFGEKLGWERANWFAEPGGRPCDAYSFGRPNWFEAVGREHRRAREAAALFDQSSFAKYELEGPDALSALSWICANRVERPVGQVTYTQMLNHSGGIECDLTVSRLAEDRFYIVTGTGSATRDYAWIARNLPEGSRCRLTEVTERYAVLSLMGPQARAVLSRVTDADLSNQACPFAQWRDVEIGGALVRALRITYVGELGWELHMPVGDAPAVHDRILEAGQGLGLGHAGYRAIESLRLEMGYRAWGSDIGPDYTPLEAGLAWAVKLDAGLPFNGREALLEQRSDALRKRLACFTIEDPDCHLHGRETIYRDGLSVGWLSSAGWGYTLEGNIGYGYVRNAEGVDPAFLESGHYELEVAGRRFPCQLRGGPLLDPDRRRIRS